MNEHGGCDFHPKPTIINDDGILPDRFSDEERENFIAVSLREIQIGLRNQSSIDWALFGKRARKMENFLDDFPLNQSRYLKIAVDYINAMRFLYSNGQGDVWLSKGKQFATDTIHKYSDNDRARSYIVTAYGQLLWKWLASPRNKEAEGATLEAYDNAIGLKILEMLLPTSSEAITTIKLKMIRSVGAKIMRKL